MQVQSLGRPDVVAVALEERFERVDKLGALTLVVGLELARAGHHRTRPAPDCPEAERAAAGRPRCSKWTERSPPSSARADRERLLGLAVREGQPADPRVVPPDADRDVAAGQQRGEPRAQRSASSSASSEVGGDGAWQRHGEAILALSKQGARGEPQDLGPDQVGRLEALRT